MATCENWQLFVHDGRHNHAIGVYTHGHAQAAKLTEEHLRQTEQFRKSNVPPNNILRIFREQNVGCATRAQKIYNVVAKIKKNRMQGRNTIDKVLCLSDQRGYAVFYKNCKDNNVLSDIVVAHLTSIEMMRTWPYEHFSKLDALKMKWKRRPDFLYYLFNTWLNPLAHKFVRCWTKSVMHFGVETTNRAESEHSVLKLWLSTCHGALDIMFLNVNSLIKGQISDIKASVEFSKTKEKFNAKRYLILRILDDIEAFWKTLEIGGCHPSTRLQDMDSEMRSLTNLLHQITTRPLSEVREMRRLAKGVLNPILPEDPGVTLTSSPEVAVTKGQKKTNSTKKDKSFWEHVSISHLQIQKSSDSGSRSGSGSGSCLGSRGRGRPPRAPRGRGRGRSPGRSSLSSVVDPSPCFTFPYTNAFLAFIYPFIENWKNVIGAGNCGYRVVADFVLGDEHQLPEIVQEVLRCMMDARYPLYTCNGFIIVANESTLGADFYYEKIKD
ncbi:hypothetical protein M9H77_30805 [Catharanthus roseus]|uniref:Uncharacterized protein n=1 Tax=Catharanthus roseus TaxID=4058 RepID=A0ACC0A2K7_CATRO|nr:hypothetical protein M9H77_30805 [Catharanthus roseus]